MDERKLNLFPSNIDRCKSNDKTARTNHPSTTRQQRELDRIAGTAKPKMMSIPLGVMVPLLMRAYEHNHTWLEDFADDNVQIDADLHDVLMKFRDLPNRNAA